MNDKSHWEHIYQTKTPAQVSWFQKHAELSLQLIQSARTEKTVYIIDVGGGTSPLVDDLLADGFRNLTVLDISRTALDAAQRRLGPRAAGVTWMEVDITRADLPENAYDVWHDRAVFHFLTKAEDRGRYVEAARRSIRTGGHLIMATFSLAGPTECSGLDTMRYDPQSLSRELGNGFEFVQSLPETHHTPFGTVQRFIYCHFRRVAAAGRS